MAKNKKEKSSFYISEYTISNSTIRIYNSIEDNTITIENYNSGDAVSIHRDIALSVANVIVELLEQLPAE